jgi:transposase
VLGATPFGPCARGPRAAQADQFVAWAAAWPERTWGVEGAGGLGHLPAQQLAAVGERVFDVQPKLAARVRLLEAGTPARTTPTMPCRSLSQRCAALQGRREVTADDRPAVLKAWSKRHRDLARTRHQVACRLHAVLCENGLRRYLQGDHRSSATKVMEQVTPSGAVALAHADLAAEFLEDMRRLGTQLRDLQ